MLDANSDLTLLLLQLVIFSAGSLVIWQAEQRPWWVAISSLVIAALGVGLVWSAPGTIAAAGLGSGEVRLRLGQWSIAVGVAGVGVLSMVRKHPRPAVRRRWLDWLGGLLAFWLLWFATAIFIGFILFLARPPQGGFR